jgi:hypothetical protein
MHSKNENYQNPVKSSVGGAKSSQHQQQILSTGSVEPNINMNNYNNNYPLNREMKQKTPSINIKNKNDNNNSTYNEINGVPTGEETLISQNNNNNNNQILG